MKKTSTNKDDQDIPELKREQLGFGVWGKYYKQFKQGSNVVVLQPEIQKVFPTSEAVNKALASMLAFTQEAQTLTHPKRTALGQTTICENREQTQCCSLNKISVTLRRYTNHTGGLSWRGKQRRWEGRFVYPII